MDWRLKGGVIIIGSLLWQDNLYDNDRIRLDWREQHLDMDNKIYIKAPIRYGRKSKDNIVTMVFSNRMRRKKGFCYVVPFKRTIHNIDELICEALALSCAEGMNGNFVKNWGVLTYLFNDSLIDDSVKKEIVKVFRIRKNINFDIDDYKLDREKSCVTKSLKLNIDWPIPVIEEDKAKLNEFHFLLATATKPTNPAIKIHDIAKMVKSDKKRRYFINNLINGIITSEDFEISKLL